MFPDFMTVISYKILYAIEYVQYSALYHLMPTRENTTRTTSSRCLEDDVLALEPPCNAIPGARFLRVAQFVGRNRTLYTLFPTRCRELLDHCTQH